RHTIESLGATLELHGLHLIGTHRHEAIWRFRDGSALLAHHFIRLGFLPGWQDVAGGVNTNSILDALREALDVRAREAGELRLRVPIGVLVACLPAHTC
ncbi:MAG: hypothetical protein ABIU54_08620, partial [Candidatus Eisenbacteria bacterium]